MPIFIFLVIRHSLQISDPSIYGSSKHYNYILPEHKGQCISAHSTPLYPTSITWTLRHINIPPSSITRAMDYKPLCP
ncbi:hypothetical protein JAAARDRAFT_201123 [Jaapia argillacea MUCL 33604]|uniref:Uncharacterized protein n=1 Tax=Jaapia argillacea MUCL 33604 TaxID=933084 RepID=A0A067P2Z6_9AGAM|nr:hypothetical protein JAAARDRAFT_201123 [Jaapia argillacea MUCL 33604]